MNNNQRDPRWANILIADLTIGQVGCTSSVLGNILGITPDVFVSRMKEVGGFLGNLIIWAKIEEAFPGIKVRRVWSYDNTDVKSNVPNVIVEVPATAIGGTGKHWVQFIGNQQCNDPWTGTVRPTSDFIKYGDPTGYCVITGTWNKPQDQQSVTDELRKARDDNWNKYQAEVSVNNDLTKQLQDEQKKNQDLRDILDKQTTADANLGNQVLDAEHARDDVIASRKRILDKLGVSTTDEAIQTITALQQPHEELVKNVVPVMDELASAAIFKRSKKATSWLQKIRDFLHL